MMALMLTLGLPLLACLLMMAVLGYLGLHVLKREVIFIDIAVAQVAGIMGAKRTSEIILMCHPLLLTGVKLSFNIYESPDKK